MPWPLASDCGRGSWPCCHRERGAPFTRPPRAGARGSGEERRASAYERRCAAMAATPLLHEERERLTPVAFTRLRDCPVPELDSLSRREPGDGGPGLERRARQGPGLPAVGARLPLVGRPPRPGGRDDLHRAGDGARVDREDAGL